MLGLVAGQGQLIDLTGQGAGLRLLLAQVGDGVLHVLGGLEHARAIGGQGLGLEAPGLGDLGVDPSKIEQPPTQAAADLVLQGLAGEQAAGVQAVDPEQAGDRDLGIIVRDRRADLGVGGDQPLFGGQDVGTPAQQVGGAVGDGKARRQRQVGGRQQFGAIGSGLGAHQHVQPVEFGV